MKNTILSGRMLENFLQNEGKGHLLEVEGSIKYNEDMRFMYVSLPINCNNVCKDASTSWKKWEIFSTEEIGLVSFVLFRVLLIRRPPSKV